MESEHGSGANIGSDSNGPGGKGAAVLLVIGEPNTEDHKTLILGEITKAFKHWGCTDVDINEELSGIANRAAIGEEGPNGERVIRHRSENFASEILVSPHLQTLTAAVKNFLGIDMSYKHLIFAGHFLEGSGAWILQDDVFTISKLVNILNDPTTSIKSEKICVHSHQEGEWKQPNLLKINKLKDNGFAVTTTETQTNHHGIIQFAAYVSNFVKTMTITDLMKSTDLVGSLKFTKPTLYIFPGCEGDSALFAMREFNLLVNGGFRKKSCFWDFARHLEKIDAMLITHLGIDNLFGLSSLLQRKALGQVHSDIGYVYMNAADRLSSVNGMKHSSLKINIAEEGLEMVEACKKVGLTPHVCTRVNSSHPLAPVNLYHKVGHGTLDMYVLNPLADSKELKEFLQQWQKNGTEFGHSQGIPLPNLVSICALLVWKPADPNEKINRILFPGNAPQHKIAEGLEKLKHLDFLKHPTCSAKDLISKGAVKKPASARPPSGKPAVGRPSLETGKPPSKPQNNTKTAPPKSLNDSRTAKPGSERKTPPKSASDTKVSSKAEPAKADKKDTHAQRSKSDLNKSVDKPKTKTVGSEAKESPKHAASKTSKVDPKKTSKPTEEKPATKGTPSKSTPKKDAKPIAESTPKKASPVKEAKQKVDNKPEAVSTAPEIPTEADVAPEPQFRAEPEIAPEQMKQDSEQDLLPQVPKEPEEQVSTGSLLDFDPFASIPQQNFQKEVPVQQNLMDDPFAMDQSKEDNFQDDQDLIQPASLPDPVAYSPQEPDVIPDSFPKDMISSFIQPEPDLIGEPDVVPSSQADKSAVSSPDTDSKESAVPVEESPVEEPVVEESPVEEPVVEESHAEEPLAEESLKEGKEIQSPTNLSDDVSVSETERLSDRELVSPVEPAATTMDALDEEVAEVEDGEESPDEVDSQGDSAEITADPDSQGSQEDSKVLDKEEDVSPFAFENKGFTDLSQNQDEGVEEMSEQTNTPEEEKFEVQEAAEQMEDKETEQEGESHADPQELAGENQSITDPAGIIFDDGFHESENNIQREINYQANGAPLDSIREEEDLGHGKTAEHREGGLNPFNGLDQAQINQAPRDQSPFDSDDPFHGQLSMGYQPAKDPVNLRQIPCQEGYEFDPDGGEEDTRPDSDEEDMQNQEQEFNPDTEWGKPMGLPSPPPPEEKKDSGESKNEKVANGKGHVNGKQPKPAHSSKEPSKSTSTVATNKEKSSVSKSKTVTEKKGGLNTTRTETSRSEKLNTSRTEVSSMTTSRTRPASAAVGEPKSKPTPRRPATATGGTRVSPTATKMPPMPAMHAYYMDLAYIPNHGNPATCDVEFFKRVRAKYYVYSSMNPNTHTLNALLDAKATWQEPELQVTLIPTYDTDVLRQWMVEKQEKLTELKVEVAPSASRCTVQLQEHETCCLAYRLELSSQA
ncbi:microtubule-associated protein futsch-like isoform X2 [Saccostrea echinata]|uniref:microtubule-associated protein futsch-like isoform X2 n=1 Tax=Saccostrea echinata TaxID=191078 RepID=UPI002A803378|nr:microtubule-associated protein futsch-like isoform X2 [Saccostrea echinata]